MTQGYCACWSIPFLSNRSEALGVFALYSNSAREPGEAEMSLVALAPLIASVAIRVQ